MSKLIFQFQIEVTCLDEEAYIAKKRKVYVNCFDDGYSFNGCDFHHGGEPCEECGRRALARFEKKIEEMNKIDSSDT